MSPLAGWAHLGFLLVGLWPAAPAVAGETGPPACAAPYSLDGLLTDLVEVEGHLRAGADQAAGQSARELEAGLGCMQELLPSMIAGRALRAVAAGLAASGEAGRADGWFRTAAEIEQAFEYGLEDLPEDHQVRAAYAAAKTRSSGEQVTVEGQGFVGGSHYLDGRKIDEPKARLERMHVYQRDDGGVTTWIITGNGFPEEVLRTADTPTNAVAAAIPEATVVGRAPRKIRESKPTPAPRAEQVTRAEPEQKPRKEPEVVDRPKPEKAPKPVEEAKPEREPRPAVAKAPKVRKPRERTSSAPGGVVIVERQRPWEKTPLMIGGGVVLAGAGGFYFAALQKKQAFNDAETLEQIVTLKQQNNRLVVLSAAVFAVGAGTLTWGVILDGQGAPLPGLQLRF